MSVALATPTTTQVLMTVELCPKCKMLTTRQPETASSFRLIHLVEPIAATPVEAEATWEDAEWQ